MTKKILVTVPECVFRLLEKEDNKSKALVFAYLKQRKLKLVKETLVMTR